MEVIGERVNIKLTEKKDLSNILSLWNNGDLMKWVGFPEGLNISIEKIQEWFNSIQKSELENHYVVFNKSNLFCGELFYMKNL